MLASLPPPPGWPIAGLNLKLVNFFMQHLWNAITFLCDFLSLFCVVSPLCVAATSLCCVAS